MNCFPWIKEHQKGCILSLCFFICFGICIFDFIGGFRMLFFHASKFWDMLFCRILSAIGSIFLLIYCIPRLCCLIFCRNNQCTKNFNFCINNQNVNNNVNNHYHVSTSIKLFLFVMTLVATVGYFFRFPFIYLLWDYDFALTYHFRDLENAIDMTYILIIIIYIWLQLLYICFHFPHFGLPNADKYIFGITLIIHCCQKWLFESLEGKEEVCEQLNSTCHHFHTSEENMTSNERKALGRMELITPLTYSCTIELLIASIVVLCLTPPEEQHPPQEQQQQNALNEEEEVRDQQQQQEQQQQENIAANNEVNLNFNLCLQISGYVIFFAIFLASIICICVKIIATFQNDDISRNYWYDLYNWIKLGSTFGSLIVNFILLICYSRPISCENPFKLIWMYIFKFWRHHEPDLIILNLAFILYLLHGFAAIVLQIVQFSSAQNLPESHLALWLRSNIFSMLAFLIDLLFLEKLFIKCLNNNEYIRSLSQNKFICIMAIYQMIKNLIRASMYFIILLDPEVPDRTQAKTDEWIALCNTFYPFTPVMNITSALCWGHFIQMLWENGMYEWFIPERIVHANNDQVPLINNNPPRNFDV